jgi:hypothetical protein
MRGAWAEKKVGVTRLVLSKQVLVDGITYLKLSFYNT